MLASFGSQQHLNCRSHFSTVSAFAVVHYNHHKINRNKYALPAEEEVKRRRSYYSSLSTSPSSSSSQLFMFTGIIEEMGHVISLEERNDVELWDGSQGAGTVLTIQAGSNLTLQGAYLGCSIAVSGVCLTATALDVSHNQFTVGLAPETLRRTYFGQLQPGDWVNLERACEIGERNSGHFVQGHVDGTGTIVDRKSDQDSLVFRVQVDPSLMPYIVPKGFIAIDGTSLTVVDADPRTNTFSFMLIEYTQKKIVVTQKFEGDLVNIEVDVLAKYSEAALAPILPRLLELEQKVQALQDELASVRQNM